MRSLVVRARAYCAIPVVPALPLILSFLIAGVMTPAALRSLEAEGHVRENYRGRSLPFPAGWLILAAAAVALVLIAPLAELADADDVIQPELAAVAVYVLGVGALGLIDDVFSGESRGWRGHGRAVMNGAFATGALKAVGALGLALYVMTGRGLLDGRIPAGGGAARPHDQPVQPARPAARALGEGVRPARRGADDRRLGRPRRCGRSACSPARCSRSASTTCASGRCSATPART